MARNKNNLDIDMTIETRMSHNSPVFDQLLSHKKKTLKHPLQLYSPFLQFECHNRADKKNENFYYTQLREQKREKICHGI